MCALETQRLEGREAAETVSIVKSRESRVGRLWESRLTGPRRQTYTRFAYLWDARCALRFMAISVWFVLTIKRRPTRLDAAYQRSRASRDSSICCSLFICIFKIHMLHVYMAQESCCSCCCCCFACGCQAATSKEKCACASYGSSMCYATMFIYFISTRAWASCCCSGVWCFMSSPNWLMRLLNDFSFARGLLTNMSVVCGVILTLIGLLARRCKTGQNE